MLTVFISLGITPTGYHPRYNLWSQIMLPLILIDKLNTVSFIFMSYLLYFKSSHFDCTLHTDNHDVIQHTIITIMILRLTEHVLISYRDNRNICEGGWKPLTNLLWEILSVNKSTNKKKYTKQPINLIYQKFELLITHYFKEIWQVFHLNTKYSNGHNNLLFIPKHTLPKLTHCPLQPNLDKEFYKKN